MQAVEVTGTLILGSVAPRSLTFYQRFGGWISLRTSDGGGGGRFERCGDVIDHAPRRPDTRFEMPRIDSIYKVMKAK